MNIKKFHEDAKIPTKATQGSGAYDLYAVHDKLLPPLTHGLIDTGITKNKLKKKRSGAKGKTLICDCGTEFYVTPCRLAKNKHHTCSVVCNAKFNSKAYSRKVVKQCVECGKTIYYKRSHAKKILNHSCSISCSAAYKSKRSKGNGNPRYLQHLTTEDRFFWDKAAAVSRRADLINVAYDLDYEFLRDLYYKQDKKCFYTKLPMKLKSSSSRKGICADFDVLSVDRIDSNLGYLKSNVVYCINSVNKLKGNHTVAEINTVFSAMREQRIDFRVKVKKLYPEAALPEKTHSSDAGYDLIAHRIEDCGEYVKVFTGLAIEPDNEFCFMLLPRSSAHKKGVTLYNNVGIIDNAYRGEIIGLFLKTKSYQPLLPGDRLLQIVPIRTLHAEFTEVSELGDTERGSGGFGSTGTK